MICDFIDFLNNFTRIPIIFLYDLTSYRPMIIRGNFDYSLKCGFTQLEIETGTLLNYIKLSVLTKAFFQLALEILGLRGNCCKEV